MFGCTIRASFHYKKIKGHKEPRNSVHHELSQSSNVYTNLKKFGSSSTPNLSRVQENNQRKKKSFNKGDVLQNKHMVHNHGSEKFMAPNFLKKEAQTGISNLQPLIPPHMGIFPYVILPPSMNNGNQFLPNNFLPLNNFENNNTKYKKLSLTPNKNDVLIKMKERVKSILLDNFSGWLPLNDFLPKYKVKYAEAFHVVNFELMKDLIYIDGKPGYQFICLLPFPVGFLKLKCNFDLQEKLAGILKDHNRKVPLARYVYKNIYLYYH